MVRGPRKSYAGGAGLLSTPGDYARFLQMLLNGGELDGVRVLSRSSVTLMTEDHLGRIPYDPAEQLVVVYMTQVIPATGLDDYGKLRALIYQALDVYRSR